MFFHFSRIVTSNHVIDVVEKIEDEEKPIEICDDIGEENIIGKHVVFLKEKIIKIAKKVTIF